MTAVAAERLRPLFACPRIRPQRLCFHAPPLRLPHLPRLVLTRPPSDAATAPPPLRQPSPRPMPYRWPAIADSRPPIRLRRYPTVPILRRQEQFAMAGCPNRSPLPQHRANGPEASPAHLVPHRRPGCVLPVPGVSSENLPSKNEAGAHLPVRPRLCRLRADQI